MNADRWLILVLGLSVIAGLVIPLVAYIREERKRDKR